MKHWKTKTSFFPCHLSAEPTLNNYERKCSPSSRGLVHHFESFWRPTGLRIVCRILASLSWQNTISPLPEWRNFRPLKFTLVKLAITKINYNRRSLPQTNVKIDEWECLCAWWEQREKLSKAAYIFKVDALLPFRRGKFRENVRKSCRISKWNSINVK